MVGFAAIKETLMRRLDVSAMLAILVFGGAKYGIHAQTPPKTQPPKRIAIRAGRLIDGRAEAPIANALWRDKLTQTVADFGSR